MAEKRHGHNIYAHNLSQFTIATIPLEMTIEETKAKEAIRRRPPNGNRLCVDVRGFVYRRRLVS